MCKLTPLLLYHKKMKLKRPFSFFGVKKYIFVVLSILLHFSVEDLLHFDNGNTAVALAELTYSESRYTAVTLKHLPKEAF